MNPILVNSSNIVQFGFSVAFSLGDNKITFNSNTLTTYVAGNAANVQGIYFQIFDASGLEVKPLDISDPDIDPASPSPYVFQLPNGFAQYGQFIINGIIVDQDGRQYKINLKKYIPQPECFKNGSVEGKFIVDSNCDIPKISVSEVTNLTYNGAIPITKTKSGVFYYPEGTIAPINFTFTPFDINTVYSGPYRIKNTTTATYDLLDNVSVVIPYVTVFDFNVSCNSKLVDLLCCIESVQNIYLSDPNSAKGRDAKSKLIDIEVPFLVASIKEKSGKDNSKEMKIISERLQCDCVGIQNIEPKIISGGGSGGNNYSFVGSCGTSITEQSVGGLTQVTIASKTATVIKEAGELGLSIVTTPTNCNNQYQIVVNYNALSENILEAIDNDVELTEFIKNIVGATGSNISLDGLDGGCVISLANCSYRLIESNSVSKTVTSITINGVVKNAPAALLLSNTSSVQSWLNSLGLGSFAVALDSGSGNIIITSNNNPANITQLILVISGQTTIRQFTKTCTALVDVLNAIIEYICDIDTTNITLGVSSSICSYNGPGTAVVNTAISSDAILSDVLQSILAAQCVLFNKILNIAVTCANIKNLFQTSSATLIDTDGLFGTKADACAKVPFTDLASILLSKISNSTELKAAFCAIVATCSAPTCSAPTNVSGVLTSGPTCVATTGMSGSIS